MARNGKYHYLAIGKDDNATLSATHMEGRKISLSTFDMSRDCFQILDGVDQLGLLLIARAYNEANDTKPSVYPLYSVGAVPPPCPSTATHVCKTAYRSRLSLPVQYRHNLRITPTLFWHSIRRRTVSSRIPQQTTISPSHLPAIKTLSVSWDSCSVPDAMFPWLTSAIPTVRTTAL